MRIWLNSLGAGVAAAAIGFSGAAMPALAQSQPMHIMTVQLPGGGVARIEYTGNVAPRVSFGTAPAPLAAFAPMPAWFGPNSPFAQLDRISTEMNREAAAMFRRAELLAAEARSGGLTETAMQAVPPGGQSYSFISTMSGDHVCSESVEVTRSANGAPHVVRHISGNCGAMPGVGGAIDVPNAAPPTARPDVVWTRAEGARPYAGLVEPIPTATR